MTGSRSDRSHKAYLTKQCKGVFHFFLAIILKVCFQWFMDEIQTDTPEQAMTEAITALDGPTGLARALNDITPQAVSQWKVAPVLRVLEIERVTGVSRHRLRPDLYPVENVAVQHN
jgi:hypothetical protein